MKTRRDILNLYTSQRHNGNGRILDKATHVKSRSRIENQWHLGFVIHARGKPVIAAHRLSKWRAVTRRFPRHQQNSEAEVALNV